MPLNIRLARSGDGVALVDWLASHAAKRTVERQIIFIQQWDHLRDQLQAEEGREPTGADYRKRWDVSSPTYFRTRAEFASLFGQDAEPSEVCDLLWSGMPSGGPLKWLMAVPVEEQPASYDR